MAIVRINPSSPTDGTGTTTNPYNTFAGKSFSAGDVILVDSGTEYVGTVEINGVQVTIGQYGSGARPKINANGGQRAVWMRNMTGGIVRDIEVYGALYRGIMFGDSTSVVCNQSSIMNCVAHDIYSGSSDSDGLYIFGDDSQIVDNEVYDIGTDGIYLGGANAEIKRNKVYRVSTDGRLLGDCIQVAGDNTLGCEGFTISGNNLDHSSALNKQGIIVNDVSTSPASGGAIEDNIVRYAAFVGNGNCIYVGGTPSVKVRRNVTIGGNYGIYLSANSAIVDGNICISANYGLQQGSTITGGQILHNAMVSCATAGIWNGNDSTFRVYNNILYKCGIGLVKYGTALEDGNCYYGNTTDQSNGGGTPSWGSNNLFADPLFLDEDKPWLGLRSDTPCRDAGVYVPGARDRFDRRYLEPHIGPWALLDREA